MFPSFLRRERTAPVIDDDTPLDQQPEFQGTITMQVRAHAVDEIGFHRKMEALADLIIRPEVSNGTMHGGLDRFSVDLVRDMRTPQSPRSPYQATIVVDIDAPNQSQAQCVGREAASRVMTFARPYVQGRVRNAEVSRVGRRW